jgi:hypothetical protein
MAVDFLALVDCRLWAVLVASFHFGWGTPKPRTIVAVRHSRTASSPCMRRSRTSVRPGRTRNGAPGAPSAAPLCLCLNRAIGIVSDLLHVRKWWRLKHTLALVFKGRVTIPCMAHRQQLAAFLAASREGLPFPARLCRVRFVFFDGSTRHVMSFSGDSACRADSLSGSVVMEGESATCGASMHSGPSQLLLNLMPCTLASQMAYISQRL